MSSIDVSVFAEDDAVPVQEECADNSRMSQFTEYQRLADEYELMRHKAQHLGDIMCEIGSALRHTPEAIVIMPSGSQLPTSSSIVLRNHPPTLLAIERLASDMRAVRSRIASLEQALQIATDA